VKTTSLEILEKSKLPPEQVHAILKAMEFEIEDHSGRLSDALVKRGELQALELRLEGRFGKLEERFGKLDAKIEAQGTRMILWVFAAAVAQATFLYTTLGHK
jgi:hypothetical protein